MFDAPAIGRSRQLTANMNMRNNAIMKYGIAEVVRKTGANPLNAFNHRELLDQASIAPAKDPKTNDIANETPTSPSVHGNLSRINPETVAGCLISEKPMSPRSKPLMYLKY